MAHAQDARRIIARTRRTRAAIHGEAGQVVILAALLMTTLLFAVGVAFDLGTLFITKRTLQEAVDAAAFAGAVSIYNTGNTTGAIAAAKTDFALNGFSDTDPKIDQAAGKTWWDVAGAHVTCPNAGLCIDVQITYNVKVPLLPAQGGSVPVAVRSTATAARQPSNYALMTLNATAPNSLQVMNSGAGTINGNVQVNSSSVTAANKSGGGTFTVGAGYVFKIVGGQTNFTAPSTIPQTGQPVVADPFSGYLRPSTSGLVVRGACPGPYQVSSTVTLDPGIYCGGIKLSGAPGGGATVTFNDGTYILQGGGLDASGNFSLKSLTPTTSHGVMFFNTHSAYPSTPTGTCGAYNINIDAGYDFSGPSSGYYQGMLLFQDKSCTNAVSITAQSAFKTGNGSLYAPKAAITIAGGGNLDVQGQVIADTITINQAAITITYNAGTSASPSVPALLQ